MSKSKNDILVEEKDFYDIISFFNFLSDNDILFELGDLPEKYIWCNAPYNTVDVIVKLYNKHMDILLWEYPCYGVYRDMNNLMNNMDETKIVGKNKYVIPILPYNLCDKIYDEWKDIEALKITISVYKKNKKEILCWHGDADKLLLEYISDDLIKVSIVPKNDKIIIDANMQIEL
jgi:hypothetical protein